MAHLLRTQRKMERAPTSAPRTLLLCVLILLTPLPCFAQPWSGILAPSRAIDWSKAGLPATLPDGETTPNPWTPPTRTQCGSTIESGASATTINAALAACAKGTYLLLGAGTFTVSDANITLYAQNGVTLRGSGGAQTLLKLTGTSAIDFGVAWGTGSGIWSGGYSQGATSITMTSPSGPPLVPGELAFLQQCDSGYSGSGCTSGSSADNGGLYVCGGNPVCQIAGEDTSVQQHQQQMVYVTSVTGTGPYTVNFSPGLYLPNWSNSNSPTISWITSSPAGNTVTPYGNGLEDLTVDLTGVDTFNEGIDLGLTYGSWVKGVRVVGEGADTSVSISSTKNCLFANNYVFTDGGSSITIVLQEGGDSDDLVLNNILTGGVPWEGLGSTEGNVVAYNYGRDSITSYYENNVFEHNAGNAFMMYEGNQSGEFTDDLTHGTHTLNTWFRNYMSGWDPPYQTVTPRGLSWDAFARFENAIGNSIGSSLLTNYEDPDPSNDSDYVYRFSGGGIDDPLTRASSMRWGNHDSVTGATHWCGNSSSPGWSTTCSSTSEVPTSLSGNATPFESPVPSSTTLPCSFFLAGYASTTCDPHPKGGTGLDWWRVCTSWTTFPTSCEATQAQPFPPIGPDVTGGPYVDGTAYDVPAAVAFQRLPIDPNYQQSFSITASHWSSGSETLTVDGLPSGSAHVMGGFQVTGASGCNSPGGGEFVMTGSTATTVTYALAADPGNCAGGTLKFPDVRQFDERVYQADPPCEGGTCPPIADAGKPHDAQASTDSGAAADSGGQGIEDGGIHRDAQSSPDSGGHGGCSCRTASARTSASSTWLAWGAISWLGVMRRRRRSSYASAGTNT
jgi:hypothetical protein